MTRRPPRSTRTATRFPSPTLVRPQGTAPMIWSGGMGWIADVPDPSNFYGPILGCGGAVAGGWNWAKYCSEALDARAAAADAMVGEDKADRKSTRLNSSH